MALTAIFYILQYVAPRKYGAFVTKKWLHFSINAFFIIVSNFMPTATTVCHLKVKESKRERKEKGYNGPSHLVLLFLSSGTEP